MDASLPVINTENKCYSSSPLFDEKFQFPKLEALILSEININKIWIDQLITNSLFPKLTNLRVRGCGSLRYLLSLPVARSLVNLKYLSVSGCCMMEEILLREINAVSSEEEFAVLPNLENVYVGNMENMRSLWNQQLSPTSLARLKRIAIKNGGKLVTVFPSYMLWTCLNLGEFLINGCVSVEEIFDVQGLDIEQMQAGNNTKLETLILDDLPNLKHIWNKDPGGMFHYKNLRKVQVIKCDDLINIFPLSIATCMEKLEKLRVLHCFVLKEIVAMKQGMEMTHVKFNFPQATYMCFRYLSSLKCFYPGMHDIEVPNLKTLIVHLCRVQFIGPETTLLDGAVAVNQPVFSFKKATANLEELRVVNGDEAKWILYGKYPVDLFCNLKALQIGIIEDHPDPFPYWFLYRTPYLEELSLAVFSFREVFPLTGSLHAQEKYFGTVVRLKKFELFMLKNLVNICKDGCQVDLFLHVLEDLCVESCDSLINLLPPYASLYHLTRLEVNDCGGLVHLIAPSTAKSFGQLVTLRITDCKALEEIVAKEVGDDREDEIEFRQLKTLELVRLGSLKSFCSSRHCSLKFLLLEKLLLEKCPKMRTSFSGGVAIAPKLKKLELEEKDEDADNNVLNVEGKYQEGDLNAAIGKLFAHKVAAKSGSLSISCNDALRLIEFLEGPLHNIKSLELRDGTDIFPLEFLRVVPKLLKLVVTSSFFYEIFSCEYSKGECTEIIVQLGELDLTDIQNVKDIRLGQPKMEPILRKLGKLFVRRCSSLISLAPSRLSFPNLTALYVKDCAALLNIFTSTTAKSLVNLLGIHIANCNSLNEVITEDGDESEGNEIVFDKLRLLRLISLPRLACFWKGNSRLNFPSLAMMVVSNCPSMKTFSQRVAVSPQLQAVHNSTSLTEKSPVLDGDLNTTITNLFRKQAEQGSVDNVEKITPRENNEIQDDVQH